MDKKWRPAQRDGSKPYKKGRSQSGFRERISGPADPSPAAEELAEYVLSVLARDHGEVQFARETLGPNHFRLAVTCDAAATGRLIGKGGKTITALRNLVQAIGLRRNKRVDVEVN
jgi:predicted RNA-binding protein YlqC (UPF0109 family)